MALNLIRLKQQKMEYSGPELGKKYTANWQSCMRDDISQLKKEIHNKDTETIQAVIKAATPSAPIEDSNTAIMKAVLPELLRNPNSMKTLIELSELGNKKK